MSVLKTDETGWFAGGAKTAIVFHVEEPLWESTSFTSMGSQVRVLLRPLRAEPKGSARFVYRDAEHREPSEITEELGVQKQSKRPGRTNWKICKMKT